MKAYRGSRKKPMEDKVLGSLLHSVQERLVNSINICRQLRQDASGETCKRDAGKGHLPPRQPTEKSVATHSSLETSSAPRNKHLLLKDSEPLSPVLLNSSPVESQSSECTSWPPENLTTGSRHSPPQQQAPSYPSHPWDPLDCPPSLPHPNMAVCEFDWKILMTSQSSQTLPGLPFPMPTTPGINLTRRPTSTTPGLNYSIRSTLTSLDLDHISRPTSTTSGCSTKEATITSRLYCSKDLKSEQLSGPQKVLPDDLKEKYIQLYWGLPWLHSESLLAPVCMGGSPLDSSSILFNGMSTYSPFHVKTKGPPQLCSPKPLFQHLVKSQPLTAKISWSQTPSETRIQAKAHDPSSLSKLSCSSAPITNDAASYPKPSAEFIVGLLERHLVKKHREIMGDLPVMVKKSQEAFYKQTSNSWGSQVQRSVVHLQGNYALVPSEISKPNLGTLNTPPVNESSNKKITIRPSCLDLSTQKVLQAQSCNDSLSWDYTDHTMIQLASDLGEPIQQAPEREVKTKAVECQSNQNCPALQAALLREAPLHNNCVPPEAPTTAQGYNVTYVSTPESLVSRAWHRETLFRSWAEYAEPNPGRVQESKDGTLTHNDHEVSVREISGASESSRSRGSRKLEETEEEESCDWTLPVEVAKLADFEINQCLQESRNVSKTLPQDADYSGLSTPHCSAAAVILQDCTTGELYQDWDPEVVLAAEMLASRTSQFSLKTEPGKTQSTFRYRSPSLQKDRNVLKNYKLQETQHNHKFASNIPKYKYTSPRRQDIQLEGTTPDQTHPSNTETFGEIMKRVVLSILNPKYKVPDSSKQNFKNGPSMTQSQGNQNSSSTVPHENLRIRSQRSPDIGMPYGNKQARASRDPASRANSCQDRAHVTHVPGNIVYCPKHGHCIKV
ncbi:Spermatogenesis-associated protein 31 [Lemmus lemmus]